jgi:nitrous oxide reductase accessory protein NosL
MRKLLFAAAASIALAGCTTTADPVSGAPTQIEIIQTAATTACRFLPTAETVANIIAAGDPRLASASAIARAICDAVAPSTGVGTLFRAVPTVGGVVVRGEFIDD